MCLLKQGTIKMNNDDQIRFKSEMCPTCVFLGQYNEYDLFYCPQHGSPTLIKVFLEEDEYDGEMKEQYGTIPIEFCTNSQVKRHLPEYIEAYNRAVERNLIPISDLVEQVQE